MSIQVQHKLIQTLTLVLALLAFIGQSNAMVNMPCMSTHEQAPILISDNSDQHSDMDHSVMNHAQMNHSDMNQSDAQSMDCCEDNGNCDMSTCSTPGLLIEPYFNSQTAERNSSIDLYSDQVIVSISSSLYRPPINY